MKKILIIGANGKIGKLLTNLLKNSADFEPIALFRNEQQKDYFEKLDVPCQIISLEESIDAIAEVMKGVDGVVFTAGSGGKTGFDKTLTVDLDGAVRTMEAAVKAGISRYVMVSAIHADNRDLWESTGIKPYYVAKHYADKVLKTIGLDYTILRPGMLLDEPGNGKITVEDPAAKKSVPREDVAALILEVLKNDLSIGKIIEFNQGNLPISQVVNGLK